MLLALTQEKILFTQRMLWPTTIGNRRKVARERNNMSEGHIPVLLDETLDMAAKCANGAPARVLDCTFGGGGHSEAMLRHFPSCVLTAIDTDPEAAPRAEALAAKYQGRVTFVDANFKDLAELDLGVGFDAIIFDLGVSSFHFDTPGRGFSFRYDADLDMRLNPREGVSAAKFLETASHDELVAAIRDYAEEPRWKNVVHAIENARGTGCLARTSSFAALVSDAVGHRFGRINPATQVFQGVRMAINHETDALENALPAAFDKLAEGGVMSVISFHSIEDRLVKRYFRREAGLPEDRNDNLPQQSRTIRAELLNHRPIQSNRNELEQNPRARSAKLRALRKLRITETRQP
jgi:16S rRNA (cytosine1402-N4)-methyltransferase